MLKKTSGGEDVFSNEELEQMVDRLCDDKTDISNEELKQMIDRL
jgi:hypothetical protein